MWSSYFGNIQKKYDVRVSTKSPLVIRFDGKEVTRNKYINLMDKYEGSFYDSLEKTVKHFTKKYDAIGIFGSDEVSFIFPDPMKVISDMDSTSYTYSNELIATFSQYFFNYFNSLNDHYKIFWHGKCFSIIENKLNSYLKYRIGIIRNVMSTYFLKRKGLKMGNEKIDKKVTECKKYEDFKSIEDIYEGTLYINGEKVDLFKYVNEGKIVKINKNDENSNFTIDMVEF